MAWSLAEIQQDEARVGRGLMNDRQSTFATALLLAARARPPESPADIGAYVAAEVAHLTVGKMHGSPYSWKQDWPSLGVKSSGSMDAGRAAKLSGRI